MASKTTNYGLNKHSPQDFYNVEARNENWDKIDEALAATDPTKITTKVEPTDGDGVMIADSADGGKAKRLLWSNVKAALEQVFGDVRTAISRHIADKSNPHEVTAEQIGSTIDYGLIAPENLQTWASEQKIGGTFMLTAQTAKGVPNTRRWRGLLVCSGDYEYADRALLLFGGDEVEICNTASGKWTNSWYRVDALNSINMLSNINSEDEFISKANGGSVLFRTTDSDWNGKLPYQYAFYARLRSSVSGSYDLWLAAKSNEISFCFTGDGSRPSSAKTWLRLGGAVQMTNTNANTLTAPGSYFVINSANTPAHGFLKVEYYDGGGFAPSASWGRTECIVQTLKTYDGRIYIRKGLLKTSLSESVEWSGWSEVILSSNIGAQNVNAAKYALASTVIDAFVLRNSAIVGGEITPGANGLIAWQYG